MEQIFIKNIKINKIRHLKDLDIQVCEDKCKHIIFTGKNGSGKTSVLDAIAVFLNSITKGDNPEELIRHIEETRERIQRRTKEGKEDEVLKGNDLLKRLNALYLESTAGVWIDLNASFVKIRNQFEMGKFIVSYYKADRIFSSIEPKHVEKVQLKSGYAIDETPREEFIKYLLDLKMTQALAISGGKKDKADTISTWFEKFDDLLKRIFNDKSVRLDFDEETFKFSIVMDGREPFDFNTLSSGYAAILDIVVDLIIRMEKQLNRSFDFTIPGIVLIDEIETHLHLELQKNIMKLLTTVFPNIQFIVSSHSPFILNSLNNVVIYDLENKMLVENGLSDVPYSGIVEGYFNADELSDELRDKFDAYKALANKPNLDDDDYEQIADLEMYLDEIPDYLALNLTTEYQELKAKLRAREA
jgi:predicted ATPase